MDIRTQVIDEYLIKGIGYRQLSAKYGFSRSTINRWVLIHQGIHNIPPTEKQQKYYLSSMNSKPEKSTENFSQDSHELRQKIALLEKQLAWEKLRGDALDTMIDIAEKQLNVPIRKKSGSQQSQK